MQLVGIRLVRVGAGWCAYVLANNRAEGNAPLTVQAIVEMLRGPGEHTGHV